MRSRPINGVIVPPHRACRECEKWLNVWHDFWAQVAIAAMTRVLEVYAQTTVPSIMNALAVGLIHLPPQL